MTKIRKAAVLTALITLLLTLSVFLGLTARKEDGEKAAEGASAELLSAETVDIAVDADTPYALIYSTDSYLGDQQLANELKALLTVTSSKFRPYPDTVAETEFEILIGSTNRAFSAELEKKLLTVGAPDTLYVWGYAYKDGKLAYAANSEIGFEAGMNEFLALVSDGKLSVDSELFVTGFITKEAYDEQLRAEEEAKRQELINALIEKNNAFADEPRLNTGYVSMIGEENAHYKESPYAKPWVYPAKNQHPRYLITEDDIDEIKALMLDPEYDVIFDNLYDLCDKDINEGVFPERRGGSGEINRYDETILAGISARAMMYLLTGDEIYAYEAIVAIKNAILTLKYTTDIHMDVYHGASHVMTVLASVYDWCYPVLTETDKWQLITGTVTCLWPTMEFNYPPTNHNGISGHGTGPQFLRDYMSLATVFYDEAPDWWEFVMGRYFEEYLPVANAQYIKGWVSQGTATYAPIKVMVIEWAAYLIKVAAGENFFTEEARLGMQFFISQVMPNGNYFQTGDGGRNPVGSAPGYAEYFVNAALYDDAFSLAWAKYHSDNYSKYIKNSIFTMTPDLQLCFISAVTDKSRDKTEDIGLIQYFVDPVGQMTARDSWDSDAAAVLMKIGNMSMSNHDAYEHGTFQIYYKGLLAGTSGSYKHYGGDSHYYYLQCTVAHNGILVFNPSLAADAVMSGNDVLNPAGYYYSGSQHRLPSPATLKQWQDGSYRMAETVGADFGYNRDGAAKYAYIAGDLTQAYDDVTVDYVGRRMLTVYTGNEEIPMVFLTFDEIASKEDYFEKTFLLHTIKEPEVDETSLTAVVKNGEGRLVLNSLFGADRIEKVGGAGKAYWINDYYTADGTYVEGKNCLDEYTPDDNSQNIWGRVQLRASGEKSTDFLTAMYVTDINSEATLEITKYQNEYVYGAKLFDNFAIFFKGAEKAYKPFSFETFGKGLYNYYISGIEDGTWNVKVDGVSVAYSLSSDGAGMLTFTAPAGKVELIPGNNVIGANGGKIQYVTGGGVLPDDTLYAYNNEIVTPLPVSAKRGEDSFLGWYTSRDFSPETKVDEVPVGFEGTFTVYARWLKTFISEDYSESEVNVKENNKNVSGINYAGTGKAGSSFETKTDEDGRNYLEWIEGSSDSFIHAQNTQNNISTAPSDDRTVSFTVELSANPASPSLVSSFQLVAKVDVNGIAWGGSVSMRVFTTDSEGNVLLGASEVIEKISADKTATLRIAVDFKNSEIRAYDEVGNVIASVPYTPPAQLGASSTEETMKCYTQYLFYWHGDTPSATADATMRIYGIKMQESNIFEGGAVLGSCAIDYKKNGGMLPKDAPLKYSTEENTPLPENITRSGHYFAGWYTTPTFDEGTRTYYVPADTEGVYTVYAKWNVVSADESFESTSVDIKESTSGSAGSLSYNAGSSGEQKPGSGFKTEEDSDGNTYLRASVGTKNAIIYSTSTDYNLTHFTETSISYAFKIKKLKGVDFPSTAIKIATSGGAYGELNVMTIDESGAAKLAGSSNIFATVGEDAYTEFYISVDFAESTITAYDKDGAEIERLEVTGVPSGKDGAPSSLAEWQRAAKPYLFYLALNRTDKTEGAVSSLAIDDIKIAEGNLFFRENVTIPKINGIFYYTDGGRLPVGAPEEYDPKLGTLLPTEITRAGYVFAGWYADAELIEPAYYVPAGYEGVFKAYAKWYKILTDEDYTGSAVDKNSGQNEIDGIWYNALNDGVSFKAETDISGNTYLRVNTNVGGKNAVVRTTDTLSKLGIAGFTESAVSFELSLSKIKSVALSTAVLSLESSSSAGGSGRLTLLASYADGRIMLNGGSVTVGTIEEGIFTKIRLTVDFAAGTVTAFGEDGKVIDSVTPAVPSGFSSLAEWQRSGLKHHILFLSFTNPAQSGEEAEAGILLDGIRIADGNIFGKRKTPELPSVTGIDYKLLGGTLPEDAPKEYDPDGETFLPTPAKVGAVFGGWYTSEDFDSATRVEKIPAGTEGIFKVYAKWLAAVAEDDFNTASINDSGSNSNHGRVFGLGAVNAGTSFETVSDTAGNKYLKVTVSENKNAFMYHSSGTQNLTSFSEGAVSWELDLASLADTPLTTVTGNIPTSSSKYGTLGVFTLNGETGELKLAGSDKVVAVIGESFSTVRITVDFEASTAVAYDLEYGVIDTVALTVPKVAEGEQPETLAEWQKIAVSYTFYLSLNRPSQDAESSAIAIDNIRVIDGRAFEN